MPKKSTLRVRLPNCEVLKLTLLRPFCLHHIAWDSLQKVKRIEMKIDDFDIGKSQHVITYLDAITLYI